MPFTLQADEIAIAIGRIGCDAVPRRTYKKFMWERIKNGYVFEKLLTLLLHTVLGLVEDCTVTNAVCTFFWVLRYCRRCTLEKPIQPTVKWRTGGSSYPSCGPYTSSLGTKCKRWIASLLMDYCVLVIEMLLMLAGDVERNPGPRGSYSVCLYRGSSQQQGERVVIVAVCDSDPACVQSLDEALKRKFPFIEPPLVSKPLSFASEQVTIVLPEQVHGWNLHSDRDPPQITGKEVDSASVDPPAIVLTAIPVHHEGPPDKVYIKVLGLSEEFSHPLFADPLPPLEKLAELQVAAEWREVGLHQGVPDTQLDIIQSNNAHDPQYTQRCLTDMFRWCLKNCSDTTYEKLVHTMVAIRKYSLAQELCMKGGLSFIWWERTDSTMKLPASVIRYTDYLKKLYLQKPSTGYDRLPSLRLSNKRFINLAIIDKEDDEAPGMDEFTKATLHWNVDDIIEKKKPLQLHQIGKLEDGSPVRCVLVQGAPGVGKTTMANELCRQWGEGKLLQEYALVVMVKMRDSRIQSAQKIHEVFYHHDDTVQAEVYRYVAKEDGRSVLFILEGYDELPEALQDSSIFADLIDRKLLPEATVLVTSRPSASEVVHAKGKSQNFQHVEVVGFTNEQIECYITDIIGEDQALLKSFYHYLTRFPYIRGIMYIPLNCSIMVAVYKAGQEKEIVPKTQTELYTQLTLILLRSYLASHPDYRGQNFTLHNITDVPQEVYEEFRQLAKLAYEGIIRYKLVFSSLPANTDHLGLVEAVPELHDVQGGSYSYNFIHLSLQEFLAAYHISQMPLVEQTDILDSFIKNKHLTVVIRFLAGFTKFHYVSTDSSTIAGRVTFFWKSLFKSREPADSLRCYIHSKVTFTETLHWLFETQDQELVRKAFGSQTQQHDCSNQFLSPFDCYALNYCIRNSECTWKLEFQNCSIEQEGLRMFTGRKESSLDRLEVLDLSKNNIGPASGELSSALMGSRVLSVLKLRGCNILDTGGTLQLAMTIAGLHSLTILNLSFNTFSSEGIELIANSVKNNPNLSDLRLSCCSINDEGTSHLAAALTGSSRLKNLELQGNPIRESGAKSLTDMLKTNTSLESLSLLGCSTMTSAGARRLLEGLLCNRTMKTLFLPDDIEPHSQEFDRIKDRVIWSPDVSSQEKVKIEYNVINAKALAVALSKNTNLTELRLTWCRIDHTGLFHLASALGGTPTLTVLDLSGNNGIGSQGAKYLASALMGSRVLSVLKLRSCNILDTGGTLQLARMIAGLHSLTILDLSFNTFSQEGMELIAHSVKNNPDLSDLTLTCCSVDDEGTSHLAAALTGSSKLKNLELQGNPIKESGAKSLADMLQTNTSLESLSLLGCSTMTSAGAKRLLESLLCNRTMKTLFLPDNIEPQTQEFDRIKDRVIWLPDVSSKGKVNISDKLINAKALAVALSKNTNLTELRLPWCKINHTGLFHLASALGGTHTLTVLDLSGNNGIGSQGAKYLASALRGNNSLTELRLGDCGIDTEGVSNLTDCLRTLSTLRILELSLNKIGSEGARDLASALMGSRVLSVLKLQSCNILDTGGTLQLARMIAGLHSLTILDLSFNTFSPEGIKLIAHSVKNNSDLSDLTLSCCSINDEGTSHLATALTGSSRLKNLELQGNPITGSGAKSLADMLQTNTSLESLSLLGCRTMTSAGALRLQESLLRNRTMKTLFLPNNIKPHSQEFDSIQDRVVWLPDVSSQEKVNIDNNVINAKALAVVLSKNTNLTELRLTSCHIDHTGLFHLASALGGTHTLTVLDLSRNNGIGSQGAKYLASALRRNTNLTELRLRDCGIDAEGVSNLTDCLRTLSTLRILDLGGNHIRSQVAKHLAVVLSKNTNLTELRLTSCHIDHTGLFHLASALGGTHTLTVLDLSRNNGIGSQGAKYLASALRGNTSLTELRLVWCGIDTEGVSNLTDCLRTLSTLRILDLGYNYRIGSQGARHLASALRGNTSLTELRLVWCGIDAEGVSNLTDCLRTLSTLRILELSYNKVGSQGSRHLASALRGNTSLTELRLFDCGIGAEGVSNLTDCLRTLSTLRILDLGWNYFGSQGAIHLGVLLKNNHSITELDLRHCDIGDDGASSLAEAISDHPSLKKMSLDGNPIERNGTIALAEMLKGNRSLEELSLYCRTIDIDGIHTLLNSLHHNTVLRKLTLNNRHRDSVTNSDMYIRVKERVQWL